MSENVESGICYLYVLDTMADWEVGYLTAELHSGRYAVGGRRYELCIIGADTERVETMGGMEIAPRKSAADVEFRAGDLLVLPGADRWADERHSGVLERVPRLLEAGVVTAAICGATVALARAGVLDTRNHTSNAREVLAMMAPAYRGESRYVDAPAVVDGNLITASGLAPLEFAREIFRTTGALRSDVLEAWYQLYRTREPQYFFALMEALNGDRAEEGADAADERRGA